MTAPPKRRKHRWRRRILIACAAILVLVLAWPIGLYFWANGQLDHMDALSGAPNTPGTTYLITGSDSRAGEGDTYGQVDGQRTDTIMLLNVPPKGTPSLISLPRDTYVADIPGKGPGKLNAAFSWGGAPLLVQTVEQLTGLTIDHYVEIGFAGIVDVVDALGGITLCIDQDAVDPMSGLNMKAGCHLEDGQQALAFVRARYFDPTGDIGRMGRQQQFVSALSQAIMSPSVLLNPVKTVQVLDAGLNSIAVDNGTNLLDVGKLALGFKNASGHGYVGTPPISNPDYHPGHNLGSTVQWDPQKAPAFWASVKDGSIAANRPAPTPTPSSSGG